MSAARAFLRPALRRKNVTLLTHAKVQRVIFDGTTAVGVEVERPGGKLETYRADREVILAAGSLESPMLLERSGTGQPSVLEAAGVPVLVDSPNVGEKLSEHRSVTILYRLNDGLGFNNQLNNPIKQLLTGAKYLFTRRGVISIGGFDSWAMLKLDDASPVADTQVFITPIAQSPTGDPAKFAGGLIGGYPMFPTSRGSIHITGTRFDDNPTIIPNYYDTEHDRTMLVKMVETFRSYLQAPELKALGASEYFPDGEVRTAEQIVDHAINQGSVGYHTLGACAMGPDDDDVVDARARVRGVQNLRVVDASIFLDQPSGNNGGPTSAAAWIASAMILEDQASS